jgi:hypothetical protein
LSKKAAGYPAVQKTAALEAAQANRMFFVKKIDFVFYFL